eukprot:6457671-Amphidinium_carterae.1
MGSEAVKPLAELIAHLGGRALMVEPGLPRQRTEPMQCSTAIHCICRPFANVDLELRFEDALSQLGLQLTEMSSHTREGATLVVFAVGKECLITETLAP